MCADRIVTIQVSQKLLVFFCFVLFLNLFAFSLCCFFLLFCLLLLTFSVQVLRSSGVLFSPTGV